MNIKYSIIIPHYNIPAYLKRLLTSIPKMHDIQVIVVDDNSTIDIVELEQVIKEDDRCEFYTNISGVQSAGVCRNIGLEYAKGKWILFADADDFFEEGFVHHLEAYENCSDDVIFFSPKSIEEGTFNESDRHIGYANIIQEYLIDRNKKNECNLRYRFVVPWSKMIKKEFLEKKNIKFEDVIVSNDVMFSTKVGLYMNSFQVTDKVIYCVTKRPNSLTTTKKEKYFDIRTGVFIRRDKYLKEHLSKDQWKYARDNGIFVLLYIIFEGFGVQKLIKTLFLFKKNKIKLWSWTFLNPIKIFKYFNKKNRK